MAPFFIAQSCTITLLENEVGMSIKSMLIARPNTVSSPQPPELSEEYLLGLLDVVNDAVWMVNADLRLIAQNKAAGELVGWTPAEVIGRHVCDLIPAGNDFPCELGKLLRQAIETRQPALFEKGIWLTTKANQSILVGGRISPVVVEHQAVGAACAFWKIVPNAGNTYMRFEFADMASHLLRTPLSIIQTSIELLMTVKLDPNEQQVMLSRMRKQNQRLRNFVNELLKILRLETEGVHAFTEPVALLPLIERMVSLVQYEQPHHTFKFAPDGPLPRVLVDPTKTELILLNLLLSAARRCPEGGEITVEAKHQSSEVIVSVIDNGTPIPVKLLSKTFWQFYPIDDDKGKMPSTYQLGLYTTKQFVELQNGRIWAENMAGQGSKFSFSMPVLETSQ